MARLGPGTAHGAAIVSSTAGVARFACEPDGGGADGVGRKFPVGPMLGTAVCVAAINVVLTYFLAHMLFAGLNLSFGPAVMVGLVALALASGAYAFYGWRTYLRRRR